ncbi:hypothetical protein [Hyphomonas sp.]|uniref:hypothetical protein n=1 Tax=Hyphomonas sp. TaxID=87 RepID=UPI00391892B6
MTPRPPPLPALEEDALDRLLGEAREMVTALIGLAAAALGVLPRPAAPAAIRAITNRVILPAEAALRRAILLIAGTLAPEPRRASQPPARSASPAPAAASPKPRRPAFRLTEPQPRSGTGHLPPGFVPRITLMDASAARSPSPGAPDPAELLSRLERRLTALAAAAGNPVREARRWLRRQENITPSTDGIAPRPPLAFHPIPGDSKHLAPPFRTTLTALNTAAAQALTPNTS